MDLFRKPLVANKSLFFSKIHNEFVDKLQVVFKLMEKGKVHFQVSAPEQVKKKMVAFLGWYNKYSKLG